MKVRGGALTLAVLLLGLTPAIVRAHAQLLESTPTADTVITTVPPEIVLTFDDLLLPSSSFELVDSRGLTVLTGAVDTGDAHALRATLPVLADGVFEVRWTAATDDGHIERATFQFTIAVATPAPSTPKPSAAPTATPSAAPSIAPSPASSLPAATAAPSAGDGGETSSSDVLVSIAAALVVVAGVAFGLMRRRKPQA